MVICPLRFYHPGITLEILADSLICLCSAVKDA